MRKSAEANLAVRAAALTFAIAVATAAPAFAATVTTNPGASAGSPSKQVATFTGEYVQGAPVYRLPTVTVSTSRAAALAAIAREDQAAPAPAGQVGAQAFEVAATPAPDVAATPAPVAVATPATVAPDRNIALDVAVAVFGTLVAIALSFSLAAARRHRRQVVLPQPRQWVAAQPYVPAADVPATMVKPGALASSVPRAAVSLTELRAQAHRAHRQAAARRRADTSQPDAA